MRQTVTPYLLYEDAGAALEWLTNAFGFRETSRIDGEQGVGHAEMDVGDGSIVYLGAPGGDFKRAKEAGRTSLVYLLVDDIDRHYARAREAGAVIVEEPTDQDYGDRRYAAEDPEGHRWYFAQPVGERPAEQSGAAAGRE
jgi:uncharacterized glyoxalase superfamily protein PhnB